MLAAIGKDTYTMFTSSQLKLAAAAATYTNT